MRVAANAINRAARQTKMSCGEVRWYKISVSLLVARKISRGCSGFDVARGFCFPWSALRARARN